MSLTLSLTITTPRFSQLQHRTSSPSLKFKPNSPLSITRASSSMSTTSLSHLSVDEDLPPNYGDWLPKPELHLRRRAGILLHPTSFQSPYGIGDLGIEVFRFIDWLHRTGCSLWQVLPLVPPGRKANEEGSPYSGQDANCGNTLLISLEELVEDGLLEKHELPEPIDAERVNFSVVANLKDPLITKAAERLISSKGELKTQLEIFRRDPNISSTIADTPVHRYSTRRNQARVMEQVQIELADLRGRMKQFMNLMQGIAQGQQKLRAGQETMRVGQDAMRATIQRLETEIPNRNVRNSPVDNIPTGGVHLGFDNNGLEDGQDDQFTAFNNDMGFYNEDRKYEGLDERLKAIESQNPLGIDVEDMGLVQGWLEDAAYFAAIDDSLNTISWYDWPEPLKNRHLVALEDIYEQKRDFINVFIAQQFLFQRQWQKVRNYAQSRGIRIMGDMPIYVGYHSADVWANKNQFALNKKGFPLLVSGVPPDAFSETGQLWGSPLYDWKAMEKEGYSWWIRRIRRAQDIYDEFRIDHFRGLAGYWAVPSEAKIAMVGKWKVGPGTSFFDAISKAVGRINITAEDLGVITEDVVQLRKSIGAPGMAVLQFAFGGGPDNPHLPHNHECNQVVYTGTHDNDTIKGWWEALNQKEKSHVLSYISLTEQDDIPWALIQTAVASVAQTAIIPMQDVLGLGNSARMNIPATQFGNWGWRVPKSVNFDRLDTEATRLKDMLSLYGRG